jgi:hypothetical protein
VKPRPLSRKPRLLAYASETRSLAEKSIEDTKLFFKIMFFYGHTKKNNVTFIVDLFGGE